MKKFVALSLVLTGELALSGSIAMAVPSPSGPPRCGHSASTVYGPIAKCHSVSGTKVNHGLVSTLSCEAPTTGGTLVGDPVSYRGSTVSNDGSGTFEFFGGPMISTSVGPVSYGEQLSETSQSGARIRWGAYNFLTDRFYPDGKWMADVGEEPCPAMNSDLTPPTELSEDVPSLSQDGLSALAVSGTFNIPSCIPVQRVCFWENMSTSPTIWCSYFRAGTTTTVQHQSGAPYKDVINTFKRDFVWLNLAGGNRAPWPMKTSMNLWHGNSGNFVVSWGERHGLRDTSTACNSADRCRAKITNSYTETWRNTTSTIGMLAAVRSAFSDVVNMAYFNGVVTKFSGSGPIYVGRCR